VGTPNPSTGVVIGTLGFTEPAGQPLTYAVTTNPARGSVIVDSTGAFTYTPTQAATAATDMFAVTASDGIAATSETVTVPVPLGSTDTVISAQYGSTTIEGKYVVQNNAYNNGGGQTINVTSTGFSILVENGSASTSGAPLAYPSIYVGCHYGNCSPSSPLPVKLSQIHSVTSSITDTYFATGTYDASYDIWLDPTPKTTGVNQQEIMIWLKDQGPIQPVGSKVATATIDGQNWQVWQGSNGQNNVVSYVASAPITTLTEFSVLNFIGDTETRTAQTNDPVTNGWYLTSIQAGFEPWNGGVGLAVDSFSATIS
jgi:VCBS repeat-containing protein